MNTKQKFFIPLLLIGALMTTLFLGCTREEEQRIPLKINTTNIAVPGLDMTTLVARATNQHGRVFDGHLNENGSVVLDVIAGIYRVTVIGQTEVNGELATVQGIASGILVTRDAASYTNIHLGVVAAADLIIREIYFGGGPAFVRIDEETGDSVFANWNRDQYIEVFNNSDQIIFLDSLIIGNLAPANSVVNNPCNELDGKVAFFMHMWMVPGDGTTHPLLPGQGAVFAPEAVDHGAYPRNALSRLDLGRAHFSMFNAQQLTGQTAPANNDVVIMDMLTAPGGSRWTFSTISPAIVIARIPNFYENWWSRIDAEFHLQAPGSTAATRHWTIREEWILDGVDVTTSAVGFGATKRVPSHIDASFVWLDNGNTVGDALTRQLDRTENGRRIYQVTRNSAADFVTARPNPNLRP